MNFSYILPILQTSLNTLKSRPVIKLTFILLIATIISLKFQAFENAVEYRGRLIISLAQQGLILINTDNVFIEFSVITAFTQLIYCINGNLALYVAFFIAGIFYYIYDVGMPTMYSYFRSLNFNGSLVLLNIIAIKLEYISIARFVNSGISNLVVTGINENVNSITHCYNEPLEIWMPLVVMHLFLLSLAVLQGRKCDSQKSIEALAEIKSTKNEITLNTASIVHELRSPLDSLLGSIDILKASKNLNEGQKREALDNASEAGQILYSKICKFLDIAKISQGHMDLHLETFNIIGVIKKIFSVCKVSAENKGLRMIFDQGKSTIPNFVIADETKIKDILINIVSNAVKFTDSGSVMIKVTWYDCEDNEDNNKNMPIDAIQPSSIYTERINKEQVILKRSLINSFVLDDIEEFPQTRESLCNYTTSSKSSLLITKKKNGRNAMTPLPYCSPLARMANVKRRKGSLNITSLPQDCYSKIFSKSSTKNTLTEQSSPVESFIKAIYEEKNTLGSSSTGKTVNAFRFSPDEVNSCVGTKARLEKKALQIRQNSKLNNSITDSLNNSMDNVLIKLPEKKKNKANKVNNNLKEFEFINNEKALNTETCSQPLPLTDDISTSNNSPVKQNLLDEDNQTSVEIKIKEYYRHVSIVHEVDSPMSVDKTSKYFASQKSSDPEFNDSPTNKSLDIEEDKQLPQGTGYIKIEIIDTGIGMDEEGLSKIFKPFQQSDASIKSKFGGSGLGLCICKETVKLMGGDINVYSKQQVGSDFIITIPMEKSIMSPMNRPHTLSEIDTNMAIYEHDAILLIEDKWTLRKKISEVLQRRGFNVYIAENYKDGLRMYKEQENGFFKAVIIDEDCEWIGGIEKREILYDYVVMKMRIYEESMSWKRVPVLILGKRISFNEGEGEKKLLARKKSSVKQVEITHPEVHMLSKPFKIDCFYSIYTKVIKNKVQLTEDNKKVLIVDDVPTNRKTISLFLDDSNIQYEQAENGSKALDIIKSRHSEFKCVLMDCEMPILNGYDATKGIRDFEILNNLSKIQIFGISGYSDEEHKKRAYSSGMNKILERPISRFALVNYIQNYI